MSDQSAASLEREANAVRNQVADTAEKLREKMTPGQMIDEVADYFRNSDGSLAFDNLKTQVRDNPLPLALVGAGLAWLFLGGGPTTRDLRESARGLGSDEDDDDDDAFHSSETGGGLFDRSLGRATPSTVGSSGEPTENLPSIEQGKSVSEVASAAYSAVGDAATGAQEAVSDAAAAATAYAAGAGRKVSKGSRRVGRQVQNGFLEVLSKEPLVLGALGIAVGTAIGAMLPSTDFEDEKVGPYRDKLRNQAERMVHHGVEEAKDVASSAYQTVKDEADRQGFSSDGQPIVERIASIGKAALEDAERSILDKVDPHKPES